MAKKKELNLTMPEPCPRKWDDMHPNDMGRHCDGCNKTLTDFTKYTDKELINYFKTAKHGLCGMFENTQLNRPIPIPIESNNSFLHKALFSSALVAGLSSTAYSQEAKQPVQQTVKPADSTHKATQANNEAKEHILKGVILDKKDKSPINGANIYILQDSTEYNSTTNSDGNFSIPIPSGSNSKAITIRVTYTGYKMKDVTVPLKEQGEGMKIFIKTKHKHKKKRKTYYTIGCPSF